LKKSPDKIYFEDISKPLNELGIKTPGRAFATKRK